MGRMIRFRWPGGVAVVRVGRHVYARDLKRQPDPAILLESAEVIGSKLALWQAAGFEVIVEDKPRVERKEGEGHGSISR